MSRPTVDIAIAAHAAAQSGHVTRQQLHDAGLSTSGIWRRAGSGLLVPVGAHTFRLASAPVTPEAEAIGVCLDLGGRASHRLAAWLHGWLPHPGFIEVTVPRRSGRRNTANVPDGVTLHTTTSMPAEDLLVVRSVPTFSKARTLMLLGALVPGEVTQEELTELMARLCDDGEVSEKWLFWLLERRRTQGRDGVIAFEEALAHRCALGPTESWLERHTLQVLEGAGLPRPRVQRRVARRGRFVARVDFSYDDAAVVMEVFGHRHHRTREQTERDTRRANRLQIMDLKVLQWTYDQVVGDPASIVADVADLLGLECPRAA